MPVPNYGYCGLNCEECPVFIASHTNDAALKERTASDWSILYAEYLHHDLTVADIHCRGCKSDSDRSFIGCRNCAIRACGMDKRQDDCWECPDFKSCGKINGFLAANPKVEKKKQD